MILYIREKFYYCIRNICMSYKLRCIILIASVQKARKNTSKKRIKSCKPAKT